MHDPSKVLMSTPGRAYGDGEVYPRFRGLGAVSQPASISSMIAARSANPLAPKATTPVPSAPRSQSAYGVQSGPVPDSVRKGYTQQAKQLEDAEPESVRSAMATSLVRQLEQVPVGYRWADSSWWDGYWSWAEVYSEARKWAVQVAPATSSIGRTAIPAAGAMSRGESPTSTADSIANLVNSLAGPARDVAATIAAKNSPQTFAAVPPPRRSTAATAVGLAAAAVAVVGLVALAKGR